MIVAGVVLLLIGLLAHISILFWIGVALAVVGAVFLLVGYRRPASYTGRRYYY